MHLSARQTRTPWPTQNDYHQATKGRFALHTQTVQAICRTFLGTVATTKERRKAHPAMRSPYKDKRSTRCSGLPRRRLLRSAANRTTREERTREGGGVDPRQIPALEGLPGGAVDDSRRTQRSGQSRSSACRPCILTLPSLARLHPVIGRVLWILVRVLVWVLAMPA